MTDISTKLVRSLIQEQFPRFAHLSVTPVKESGWDNRTFRLGETMVLRLPSAECYAPQVSKEQRWLSTLSKSLPLPIPAPLAKGFLGRGYPWPWSIYRWLDGETLRHDRAIDAVELATDLAAFLVALHRIDTADGPVAGDHNFHRGGDLSVYDEETRRSIAALERQVDIAAVTEVWNHALATSWQRPPVWVHGDIAVGNLLVTGGRLSAVIDFGCAGVGDPACDLVMAWTFFDPPARAAFAEALSLDLATWERARGWALWKALITLAQYDDPTTAPALAARHVINEIIADHTGVDRLKL